MIFKLIKASAFLLLLIAGYIGHDHFDNWIGLGDGYLRYIPIDVIDDAKAVYTACNKYGLPGMFYNPDTCRLAKASPVLTIAEAEMEVPDLLGK